MSTTPQIPTLAQWHLLYDDQDALVKSPETHQAALIELANALHVQGVIDSSELADLLEQADAAYAWAVEEGQ